MIEFNGYISGDAYVHFWKKTIKLTQNISFFGVLFLLPIAIIVAINMKIWIVLIFYCVLFVAIPFLARIPKTKKEILALTPNKIFTDEEYIVCVANKYEEFRLICDVKLVNDHGEFYELIFPFGKISDKFICRKSLLTKGTIEEFEALFPGKIKKIVD